MWALPVVMQGVAFVFGQLQGSRHAWGRQAVRSVGRQRVGELRPASLLPTPRTILVLTGRSRALYLYTSQADPLVHCIAT